MRYVWMVTSVCFYCLFQGVLYCLLSTHDVVYVVLFCFREKKLSIHQICPIRFMDLSVRRPRSLCDAGKERLGAFPVDGHLLATATLPGVATWLKVSRPQQLIQF